ncbi:hypothetical protein KHS38_15305 [Mucilaginibacter sp. Bleaf8]|uniref:hypothetical protein n=1 Tax=Mucilaginibacter sp. Bleaf8 TaxID=2834430 RepID=UPI001BCB7899|nr:hypothetical protein [Mucilaginibacter sp. Bleaf8]MBS7565775.1 hypothetical protein [Mucilaginibacter sp. Bleaf8]
MKTVTTSQAPTNYNEAVKQAYLAILKAKQLLAAVEEEPLRYTLVREEKKPIVNGTIVHELISPLLYLRLECYANDELAIHYGFELSPAFGPYYSITASFVRMIYKLTMHEEGKPNIESCIRTDYVINECSGLYEYIEERGCKHHRFEQVKYKAAKRKLRKVA